MEFFHKNLVANSVVIKPIKSYSDIRGVIATVIDTPAEGVLFITSKAGTKRANHYHKTSGHYCVLTKGKMKYYERACGVQDKPKVMELGVGEVFWTGPMVEHLMVFTEDSEFWCFSTGCRNQENYEDDLVRLEYQLDEL